MGYVLNMWQVSENNIKTMSHEILPMINDLMTKQGHQWSALWDQCIEYPENRGSFSEKEIDVIHDMKFYPYQFLWLLRNT